MSFTRPSTALAVIEGLGMRLGDGPAYTTNNTLKVHVASWVHEEVATMDNTFEVHMWLVGSMKKWLPWIIHSKYTCG